MADSKLIKALNRSLNVGASASYAEPAAKPRTVHDSHALGDDGVCTACAMDAQWEGIERKCRGGAPEDGIRWDQAGVLMPVAVGQFLLWWRQQGHEAALPSLQEWIINFSEWYAHHREKDTK